MFLHGALRQFPDGADERALERRRSPVHQSSRRIRLHPSIDEMLRDEGQILHAHDEHKRGSAAREARPVLSFLSGFSWPVTMVTEEEKSLWVSGMPA